MTTHKKKGARGLFITFEGIDGCGKSTQLKLTARFLKQEGIPFVELREPGSTPTAERIRRILLDRKADISDVTELLLYEAARAEITSKEIAPHLAAGRTVLCDRFYDSTTAYQGYGRKLDLGMVKRLHRIAVGDIKPDLTFVFDLPVPAAFARLGKQHDRLESQSKSFFRRVRRGFQEIAHSEPSRVKLISSSKAPPESVFELVKPFLIRRLARR